MNFDLRIENSPVTNGDKMVDVIFNKESQEIYRKNVRLNSEAELIKVSKDIVEVSGLNMTDVKQGIATQVQSVRTRLARESNKPDDAPEEETPAEVVRYLAVMPDASAGKPQDPQIVDVVNGRVLCNFVMILCKDIEVQDDIEADRVFESRLLIFDRTLTFRIGVKDFADNSAFKAALFAAGGCQVVINCNMDELRRAVSTISRQTGELRTETSTTNFGWTTDKQAYLAQSVKITKDGVQANDGDNDLKVDLSGQQHACRLNLQRLDGGELLRVKTHIVRDLLALHDPVVMHSLLAAVGGSIMYPFAVGAGRMALWLVGRTGVGKSFASKLMMNFFGEFPVSSGDFVTWSSTANYVQHQGYFFKDALYLVDDYKPEVVPPYQAVRILQTYADNTGRGRMRQDATANVTRPIRGLLMCTGEDMPEHNASAIARSVIIRVPQRKTNQQAGNRCLKECKHYSGVTADFIRWVLVNGHQERFTTRFLELQTRYHEDVKGQQNDSRISSNLAILGAAFELMAEYLSDVWPGWKLASESFVNQVLVEIRDAMLGEAKDQQGSEVFLRTLAELIRNERVRVDGLEVQAENKPLIGRVISLRNQIDVREQLLVISAEMALAAVNESLRSQGRADLKLTLQALYGQLKEDGKLRNADGGVLGSEGETTRRVWLGDRQQRVITVRRRDLLGE